MELYTTTEAANHLGLCSRTVQAYIRQGKLIAIKKGKIWLIRKEDLKDLEQSDWFQIERTLKVGRPRKDKPAASESQLSNDN